MEATAEGPIWLMYSNWDIMVRELGGGIWFWTSLWLIIAFVAWFLREATREGKVDPVLLRVAAALVIYFTGSMLRGFLTWMQFFYAGNAWNTDAWVATWPWFGMSVLLNITGAAMCIWLLSSWRWRFIFTMCAVIAALVMPIGLRMIV